MAEHEHGYSMCVHGDKWHVACTDNNCPDDHYSLDKEPYLITCEWCGSPDHAPIACPNPSAYAYR